MVLKKISVLILTTFLIYSTHAIAKMGTESGGGGDASEARVDEIRSDILNWVNKGGAKELNFPEGLTYEMYNSLMSEVLKPKTVVVGFVEKDDENNDELKVSVKGVPKTCRGFISKINSRPHILCNIARFKTLTSSEQYVLIHHEFAGLVNVENNEEAASDYLISNQLTDYLRLQKVLKLAINKNTDSDSEENEYDDFENRFPKIKSLEDVTTYFNELRYRRIMLEDFAQVIDTNPKGYNCINNFGDTQDGRESLPWNSQRAPLGEGDLRSQDIISISHLKNVYTIKSQSPSMGHNELTTFTFTYNNNGILMKMNSKVTVKGTNYLATMTCTGIK